MIEVEVSLIDGSLIGIRNLGDSPKDKVAFDGVVDIFALEGIKYLKEQEEKEDV